MNAGINRYAVFAPRLGDKVRFDQKRMDHIPFDDKTVPSKDLFGKTALIIETNRDGSVVCRILGERCMNVMVRQPAGRLLYLGRDDGRKDL